MSAFTCPKCGRTSQNRHDAEHGYCGACHAFTGDAPWPADDDEDHPDFPIRRAAAALALILAEVQPAKILPGEPLPPGVRELLFEGDGVSLRTGTLFYGVNGEPIELPPSEAFAVITSVRETHERDGGMVYVNLSTRLGVQVQVSTAYLGVDMSSFFGPLPLVWETLVAVGEHPRSARILDPWRYATLAAAHTGHARIVEAIRQGIETING